MPKIGERPETNGLCGVRPSLLHTPNILVLPDSTLWLLSDSNISRPLDLTSSLLYSITSSVQIESNSMVYEEREHWDRLGMNTVRGV